MSNWLQKIAEQSPELQNILNKWKEQIPGIVLSVFEEESRIVLISLIIPKNKRKKGLGSKIVQELNQYADKVGKRIELSPGEKDPHHGTTSRSRLERFYKKLDFVKNKGRNTDYQTGETMYRKPQSKPMENT